MAGTPSDGTAFDEAAVFLSHFKYLTDPRVIEAESEAGWRLDQAG